MQVRGKNCSFLLFSPKLWGHLMKIWEMSDDKTGIYDLGLKTNNGFMVYVWWQWATILVIFRSIFSLFLAFLVFFWSFTMGGSQKLLILGVSVWPLVKKVLVSSDVWWHQLEYSEYKGPPKNTLFYDFLHNHCINLGQLFWVRVLFTPISCP